MTTRRDFLKGSLTSAAAISLSAGMPRLLAAAGAAASNSSSENVLVMIQLSGGNDGLNTVIPHGDDGYRRNRFSLAVPQGQIIKIDDYLGFHPSFRGMNQLLEDGSLSILQGIGYPKPNRSHFESMDIWHTANLTVGERENGWLGRFLDENTAADAQETPALHLGEEKQPLALVADRVRVPSVQSLEGFKLQDGGNRSLRRTVEKTTEVERPESDELLSFLQRSTQTALTSSEQVQAALSNYNTPVNYPGFGLARKLRTVAQMIDAGLKTRIYYVTLGGFDTHSDQKEAHAGLLQQLSESLSAFLQDLQHQGNAQRVLSVVFSEFGRRVKENGSRGTDHGAAAPMFLAGDQVKSGVIGKHPSLTDLDDGDLKFHTDFRQIYATLLEDWLRCDSQAILGRRFKKVNCLA